MSLKRNIIANYAGQGWSGLMSLAFVPMYIQYLGIEAYGLIGVFAMLQVWLTLLDMGMTPALSREMARFTAGSHSAGSIHNLLRTLEVTCSVMAIVIGIGLWLASGWLASGWLKTEELPYEVVADAIAIMGWVAALRFIEGVYRAAILGLQKQVYFNTLNALFSTIRAVGAIAVLAWWAPTIKTYFVWQGLISIATVLVLAIATHKVLPPLPQRPNFSWASLSSIKGFAGGIMLTTVLTLLLTQIDKVLLSKLLSLQDFGYYALAGSIAGSLSMLIGPIAQAAYPHMSKLVAQQDEKSLIGVYHNSSQLLAVILTPAVLAVSFYATEAIYVWSGDVTLAQSTAPILQISILGSLLHGMMSIPYMLQLAYAWTGFAVRLNVVAVLVLVPALLFAVPRFGGVGAAWIWFLLNLGYITFSIHLMHRRLLPTEKWRWYVSDLLIPTLGAVGVLSILHPFHPGDKAGRMAWLVFLAVNVSTAFGVSAFLASQIRPRILALCKAIK